MAAKWGLFLCNCHQTLPVDPQRLVLPTAPSVLAFADHPERDIPEFVKRVHEEQVDRVVIGCCASPGLFEEPLNRPGTNSPKLYFADLRESCFRPHPDPKEAHAKATRLLRATMESAGVEEAPAYNPLSVGRRILIASDGPEGLQLAERLGNVAEPILVLAPGAPEFDGKPSWKVSRGRVVEVRGRLGDFHVTVEDSGVQGPSRRELQADQVVVISRDGALPFRSRTGFHLLTHPGRDELDRIAERGRELIGDFFKGVRLQYNTEICAGGTADQEACGICIPACPYEAISRDPQNHLRVQIDHMACEECGACASACPTSALRFIEPSPQEVYARLAALLAPHPGPTERESLTVLFHCAEQGKRLLKEAGRRPMPYPASVLPVEMPCLRSVSEAGVLAAFRLGAAGVGLLGCEACQHGERELLFQKFDFCRLTLDAFGLGSDRLRFITVDSGREGEAITALSEFARTLSPTPIRGKGEPLGAAGNREVIAEAISVFIQETGREPGRRPVDPSLPFALADVESGGCTMCRSCVNVCPVHAFRMDENALSLQFKQVACVACGLCEQACPEHVISLRREIYFERDALEYQTVVEDNTVSCSKCGKPYINRKALEKVEARVFSLESLWDTFSGERRSLLRMCPDCRAVAAMLEVEKGWKP